MRERECFDELSSIEEHTTPMRFLVSFMAIGVLLASLLVVVVVVSGCGGAGTQQNNNASQEGGGGGGSKAQQSSNKHQEHTGAPKRQSLSGTVAKSLPDKDKVIIRPEKAKVVPLRYRPEKVEITLEGKAAKPEAIREGQKATVEYVKKTNKKNREVNIARSIALQSATGGQTTG